MSQSYCPSCDAVLTSEAINIEQGVALCPSCGKLSRLSEVIAYERPSEEIVNDPPAGCTVYNGMNATLIRVSLRSLAGFFGALFVCLFWNGITGVFVLIAAAGLYTNVIGPPPAWFPAPTMDAPMDLGATLFLCIFLIPFVTIGTIMIGAALLCAMGSTAVSIGRDDAWVRTGVGPIGIKRRFDPRAWRSVNVGKAKWQSNDQHKELIQIEADKTIRFASVMSEAKRDWLIAVLRRLFNDTQA